VALDHMEAVRSGDPVAMAADYAPEAVLERAGAVFEGHAAIEAYFETLPSRLGPAKVVFDELSVVGETATFRWHLEGCKIPASGTDVCTIERGSIVHQVVHLETHDF
jgi:ketosteroid isomerase-like protein